MDKSGVYLSYIFDPAKECNIGFWVETDEVETIKEIAKRNRLQLIIGKEFDFTKKGEE